MICDKRDLYAHHSRVYVCVDVRLCASVDALCGYPQRVWVKEPYKRDDILQKRPIILRLWIPFVRHKIIILIIRPIILILHTTGMGRLRSEGSIKL